MPKDSPSLPTPISHAVEAWLDQLPALSIDEVAERTLTRTLNAATIDDVLANPEAMGLEPLAGEVITVTGVDGWLPSVHKGGLGRFVVIGAVRQSTGEKVTLTCGSPYVITRIMRAAELGALPFDARVLALESKSNPGQESLWLVKP